VRGAFTGAVRAKDGLLATAEGGTVFLDEVGELRWTCKPSCYVPSRKKKCVRSGTRAIPIKVRILAPPTATWMWRCSRDLPPRPLLPSERAYLAHPSPARTQADIPLLIGNVLERINRATQMQHSVGDDALRLILNYDWPGNVRELENCIERACTTCSLPTIHIADLPTPLRTLQAQAKPPTPVSDPETVTPIAELEKQAILHAIEVLQGTSWKPRAVWASARPRCIAN